MVLNDLGKKITDALRKMGETTVLDDEVVDTMVKEICAALLQADVSVKIVKSLRDQIKKNLNFDELKVTGAQKRRHVQQTIFDQLCLLISDPGIKPYKPSKGKSNVLMMVGLQGSGKTTTVTKIGSYYQRKGWKVALVTTIDID
jgi:signal recognition particle subunit SRP54